MRHLILASFVTATVLAPVVAQETTPSTTWTVGTKIVPPFVMRSGEEWTGITVELVQKLAEERGAEVEFVEAPLDQLLESTKARRFDFAAAAISVTAERERQLDFSHPYFRTGLGIAVREERLGAMTSFVHSLGTPQVLSLLGLAVVALFVLGTAFWLAERRSNEAYRDAARRRAIGVGVWWSLIMFLGHKGIFPKTLLGRFLAATTMIASILIFSGLIGAISSSMTIERLGTEIRQPSDLRFVNVGAIAGTTSAAQLVEDRIPFRSFPDPATALAALAEERIDAVVYDEAVLRHLALGGGPGAVSVLDLVFDEQDYAIALPRDSELRKPLNEAILTHIGTPWWKDVRYRYLGR